MSTLAQITAAVRSARLRREKLAGSRRPTVEEVAARIAKESPPATVKPWPRARGGPVPRPQVADALSSLGASGLSPASPSPAIQALERAVEDYRDIVAGHVEWCELCRAARCFSEACGPGQRLHGAAVPVLRRLNVLVGASP